MKYLSFILSVPHDAFLRGIETELIESVATFFPNENWTAGYVKTRYMEKKKITHHYVMCQCFFLCFVPKCKHI